MPIRPLVRAGVAALCAAGVLAGVVTYRNERRLEDAFRPGHSAARTIDLFEGSRALNPDAARETGEAGTLVKAGRIARAEQLLEQASAREPDNVRVWVVRARLDRTRGQGADARRHWDRARSLDPQLPRRLPSPL